MWNYGMIILNGEIHETAWKLIGGAVAYVDLPPGTDMTAAIEIEGTAYVIASMSREDFGDRITVPLMTRAAMDAIAAAQVEAAAKAKADFEGTPWPIVEAPLGGQ